MMDVDGEEHAHLICKTSEGGIKSIILMVTIFFKEKL